MKLNYKRTILVGFAFFLISAFWQAYDAIVPLILTNHFGLPQTASGVVMSADNVLAVFMLPIFGALSDKICTRFGKRTPFIVVGTVAAVITFFALTLIDNYQLGAVIDAGIADRYAAAADTILPGFHTPSVTYGYIPLNSIKPINNAANTHIAI